MPIQVSSNEQESSLAIRAVYGRWFPWLVFLDLRWASQQILARLRALWEQRFMAASGYTIHNVDTDELAAFGWWFSSEKFDKVWAIAQLEATLKHNGRVEAAFMIVEYLAKLSSAMPLSVLKCLGLLIESDREEWRTSTWHEQVREILAHAHQSSDIDTRQE